MSRHHETEGTPDNRTIALKDLEHSKKRLRHAIKDLTDAHRLECNYGLTIDKSRIDNAVNGASFDLLTSVIPNALEFIEPKTIVALLGIR